ncbi:LGFP repeat-containing protein, partial [Arthrobacter sp. Soil764]
FQNGAILWSTATGAQISPNGPIRDAWKTTGFEGGILGYPTGPVTCAADRQSCSQPFQGGRIDWTAAAGARIIRQ